ncbi:MAG: 4Fe-4S binding protein [Chloroflexi bacterium]|nr:4Fe-4S binding protein [Chloroflexota bacterium]MBI5349834.1 4Fe-4S binding protein [Chloroflexota bacterium]
MIQIEPTKPATAVAATSANNLLKNKFIGGFVRSRWYPGIFQWPTALIFAVIVYELLLGPVVAHNNLGTALTWVLWWPVIPILFVFLGRFWCTICPFGTLSDVVQKFVGHQRAVPMFLKKYGIWIIDALFILITWSDHVWGIVESPWGSGMLLLLLTTGVVVAGAFFERRTWCRYLCFLGGLSGNYARTGMLALRATPSICAQCKVSACYKGSAQAPGCSMFEFPRTMATSALCNVCGDCIKSCPNDSIRLTLRPPTQELWFIRKPKLEEAFLAIVIMGIVFIQNITMLEVWQSILRGLENLSGTQNYAVNFTITFLIAMLIPIILLGATALLATKLNGDSLTQNFAKFGYAIIPLDVAGHVAHNLFHLLAEGKAVLFTAMAFVGQVVPEASPAIVDNATIQILQFVLIALGVGGSLYAAYRIAHSNYSGGKTWATLIPYTILIIVLGGVNIWLFILPMAMRM